jgi:ribosomal protein S18 acetylase RimI-like enzyme
MNQSPEISLRPADNGDLEFCFRLYIESRKGEVEAFGWAEAAELAFFRMQFEARERAYRLQFPGLVDEIITLSGSPVGRIFTSSEGDGLLLIDIAILSDHQGSGIGTQVVRDLQAKALIEDKRVLLRVDKTNHRAIVFYKKLGFVIDAESQIQYSMRWSVTGEAK